MEEFALPRLADSFIRLKGTNLLKTCSVQKVKEIKGKSQNRDFVVKCPIDCVLNLQVEFRE